MAKFVPILLALAMLALSLWLFPWDSDASFAVNDPLGYAHGAETTPWSSIVAHHPLIHVLAAWLVGPLQALHVEHPGHVAVRILSGLGAACSVLLLAAMAGWARAAAACALILPLICTRGFLLESATGESVVTSAALCVATLWVASRSSPRPWRLALLLFTALLWRQDNILILPSVALLLLRPELGPGRVRRAGILFLGVGMATLLAYGALWRVSAPQSHLLDWMLAVTQHEGRSWALASHPRLSDVPLNLQALGAAVVGVHRLDSGVPALIAAGGFLFVILLSTFLLRGGRPASRSLLLALGLAILVRFPFFLWFEPQNFEWWLPSLAYLVAMGCTFLRGPRAAPKFAFLIPLLGALLILGIHGESTLSLRERHLATCRDQLTQIAGASPPMVYLTYGATAHMAFHLDQREHDTDFLRGHPEEIVARLIALRQEHPTAPLALFFDRFVKDGQPVTRLSKEDALTPFLEGIDESDPAMRVFRHRDRVFALGFNLP
jgi:hypothetical protein